MRGPSRAALWLAAGSLLLLLGVPGPASAAPTPRVAVLTMTPGPHLFERFGHTAIRVDDRVYNFGTFDAGDPELVRKFLGRRLTYWLSVADWPELLRRYDNRRITVEELALSDDEARDIAARLDDNARPERREYRYDFFVDNCATRVRDAVDGVTSGALGAFARARPSRTTFRGHVRAVLSATPWLHTRSACY